MCIRFKLYCCCLHAMHVGFEPFVTKASKRSCKVRSLGCKLVHVCVIRSGVSISTNAYRWFTSNMSCMMYVCAFSFLCIAPSMLLTIPWHVFLWLRPNVRRRSMLHNVGRQTYSFGCLFNYKFTIKISCSCRQKNQSDGSKRCATTYLDLELGWWMSVLLGVKRFIYS